MKTVVVDNKLRVRIPGFKPGQVFAWEAEGEVVTLTPVKPVKQDAPVVKLVKGQSGLYRLPSGVKVSRESIRAAVRADRDAR